MKTLRVAVSTTRIVEVHSDDEGNLPSIDDIRDSFMNDELDAQDAAHETSDDKVMYVPRELAGFSVEIVPEGDPGETDDKCLCAVMPLACPVHKAEGDPLQPEGGEPRADG
jgi:hypothetical protein